MEDVDNAFHVSLGWTLTTPSEEVRGKAEDVMKMLLDKVEGMEVRTEEVKVKIGNVVTSIELPKLLFERKSLFGV